ncbi:MAG: D-alanyl-D-alanine carboxypeptidase [Clostridia bacterium]|nr:D-alanyl-D-alanine carboxypeptidase [Clostridia bacterium]
MKRVFSFILIGFLLLFTPENVNAISVSAECACVIDMSTGRVIYEKNMNKQHTMASTTKIMTALVALENSNLEDIVTVSKNATGKEGTSLYLKAGQKVSMEDLLYGLMLQSGNDAAVAIAEGVSGSVEKFAETMTERAKALGAKNSSFKNPNGLDEEGHFTTAYDLAMITKEALKNKKFSEIVSTKSKTILDGTQTVSNHNKMLRIYDGCIGVKTGFTKNREGA